LLFEPERLNKRFELFENIALASLKDQTDQDFKLSVLSSTNLPEKYKTRLQDLCNDTRGADHVDINYRGPRKAGKLFRQIMCEKYPDLRTIAQVVLDDDDAVSRDFVEVCKREADYAANNNYDGTESVFLTFPKGVSLGLEHGHAAWIAPRNAYFTNLGLTLVAPDIQASPLPDQPSPDRQPVYIPRYPDGPPVLCASSSRGQRQRCKAQRRVLQPRSNH